MIRFEEADGLEPVSTDTMTPMIDVILSLIAFMMLMINAPLLTMDVDLPDIKKQERSASSETKLVNLEILEAKQNWRIDGKLITSDTQLEFELKSKVIHSEQPVSTVLTIDQDSPAQRMIDTLDILNRLGIQDTQIALETAESSS